MVSWLSSAAFHGLPLAKPLTGNIGFVSKQRFSVFPQWLPEVPGVGVCVCVLRLADGCGSRWLWSFLMFLWPMGLLHASSGSPFEL